MDILGAVIFMLLPYMAGYSCKNILRWKETNQIETYLIGFFLLFFLQAVIFIPFVWMGKSLTDAVFCFYALLLVLAVLFAVCVFITIRKKKNEEGAVKTPWKKADQFYFLLMIIIFLLILVRMAMGMNILRNDIMLETVLTTIQTDTLFVMHPLTGRVMEAGMITSKKLITLPLFYAAVIRMTGLEAEVFLYFVMGVVTLVSAYYANELLFSQIVQPGRFQRYLFRIILGVLILSGDYHEGVISYQLLYRGYEGSTICFAVILPYLLYLITSWYKREVSEEKPTVGSRFVYFTKILMGLLVSLLLTGMGTGFVFLFMATVIASICCLLKSIKEVRECRES